MTDRDPSEFGRRTIGGYLAALASGSPTPGGGSAAGLAGAMGCALGEMVCNLTLARQHSEALATLSDRFSLLSDQLIELAELDEHAFANYRLATALPRSTDEEKVNRRATIEAALIEAAEVPLQMIVVGHTGLDCLRQTAELGTPYALGDLMTGGYLLQAMSLGAMENIEANASSMKVSANRERFAGDTRAARSELDADVAMLHGTIEARRSLL
jgi:formiminotetrahydrofolate cyclodeaminase